ncbi:hypothetical protein MED121_13420 [Marinomonas sp. MED121]|uniref:hypothetical protein n=1 Tax=Marinomonas sp. MED121 TaxID=314277 RepID=UPI0000690016|nr:hypothetical protein [Marinomonas sp. MED121]EAQ66930.1 hypothetical protein MED121_13420 [Marinomonas sp. MED121]
MSVLFVLMFQMIKLVKNQFLFRQGYKKLVLLLVLSVSGQLYAHGLTMTTAELTLRNNNHLTVTVRVSLTELFNRMNWQHKPPSLIHLMAEDGIALAGFRGAISQLFLAEMPISFMGQSLISPNLRLPNLAQLKQQVEADIAYSLMPAADEHDRSNYLVVYLDGFIPKKAFAAKGASSVEAVFPEVLGDIMVSFNRPLVQTLPATKGDRQYQESFY